MIAQRYKISERKTKKTAFSFIFPIRVVLRFGPKWKTFWPKSPFNLAQNTTRFGPKRNVKAL